MNSVETVLLSNIDNPNSCFIFPTDIAASRWADHLLRLRGGSVAMRKFIAWDVFKQNSIKSKVQNKKSIPTALRKIFVGRLIKENAERCQQGKEPLFSSLINIQWADKASGFVPWLTKILPQLGTWFAKTTGLSIKTIFGADTEKETAAQLEKFRFENDERDMFVLARHYAQFLEKHGLFEPAWETPPFDEEGMDCFIFFPRSLSDYGEYRELLASSGHVKTIDAAGAETLPCDTFFYTNSRREITEAALYIRALHEKQGINWDSIAVCIADTQDYEPYVIREFTNRNIPFVRRISRPLADYPSGSLFRSVLDCVSQDFSFSSFVSLILNKNLPWKDTNHINNLVTFGKNNNCFYSWIEKDGIEEHYVNVWEDAFKKPLGGIDPETRKFFERMKQRLQAMRYAASFSELRRQYFIFREQFMDMEKCSEEVDLVLSRCIAELMTLVQLEKDFPDAPAIDSFIFFTEHLSETYYLAQPKTSGVAILPYKAAAAAPFDCHIILGSDQENLSVVYSHLDFLPKKKREQLGIPDEDASEVFINLHKYNSVKNSAFFCSEQTFSGFTIPHSKTGSPSEPKDRYATAPLFYDKFSLDHYSIENSFCSSLYVSGSHEPVRLHENQIKGFTEWKNRRKKDVSFNGRWNAGRKLQELINFKYTKDGKVNVSASSMQPYFQCSLKWLFERVFSLENAESETSLMAENISGLVYHAVLNHFLTALKNKEEKLLEPVSAEHGLALPETYVKLLEHSINTVFDGFPSLNQGKETHMSALTSRLLQAGKKDFQYHLENCLSQFISYFAGCIIAGSEIAYQVEQEAFTLKGIVDCILKDNSETDDGKYIIVDFKLKKLPKREDCTGEENALSNFQLPMYITLTEENNKFSVYTALFYNILESQAEVLIGTIRDVNTGKIIPKKEEERIIRGSEWYNSIFDEFNKKTEQFSQEISTGNLTVFETKVSNCFNCAYQRICRTVYIIGRENIKTWGKVDEYKDKPHKTK
jgi:hypothetical protein